jgi:hypothetical protein
MAITWNDPIKGYFATSSYNRIHMLQVQPQMDLADYNSVKVNAVLIYQRVADKSMPPGRPWDDAWIANFKTWVEAGCPES